MVHRQNELWDPRRRHGLDEAGAGPDNSFLLCLGAHHEARHILHEEQRNSQPVAPIDEVGDFLCAFRVDDAAKSRLFSLSALDQTALIRDDTDRDAIDARVAADHLPRDAFLELVNLAVVENRTEHCVHVVGHAMIGRQKIVQVLALAC